MWPKIQGKSLNILRAKITFRIIFFLIFKRLSLKEIKQILLEGESPTLSEISPILTEMATQKH